MDEEKILNLLHIARKAGKLQFGYGACERSCTNGNSKLVICASDLAENTRKNLKIMADAYNTKIIELGSKKFFGESFKMRDIGIICVEDSNFARGINRLLV